MVPLGRLALPWGGGGGSGSTPECSLCLVQNEAGAATPKWKLTDRAAADVVQRAAEGVAAAKSAQ